MTIIAGGVIVHADALHWLARQEPGAAAAVIYDPPYAVGTPVRGREDGAAGSVSGPLSFMQKTMPLCARALRPGGIVIVFGDYKRLPDLMYAATTSGLRLSGCVAWVRTRPGTGGLFRSSWDPVLIASRGTPDAVDRSAVRNVIETDVNAAMIETDDVVIATKNAAMKNVTETGDVVYADRSAVKNTAVKNTAAVIETSELLEGDAAELELDGVVTANYPAKRTHPYSKPPEVLEYILARVCRRGDVVLDPFAGSGSSRVAAEKLGLDLVWRGADIDPQFAEVTGS